MLLRGSSIAGICKRKRLQHLFIQLLLLQVGTFRKTTPQACKLEAGVSFAVVCSSDAGCLCFSVTHRGCGKVARSLLDTLDKRVADTLYHTANVAQRRVGPALLQLLCFLPIWGLHKRDLLLQTSRERAALSPGVLGVEQYDCG